MKSKRNDPCWCGSGKKYEQCHLGRENKDRPVVSDSIKAFRDAQRRRLCLHPDSTTAGCDGIINAHTVQSQLLRKISRVGHVYGFSLDFSAMVNSQGVIRPQLMGISKASTFTGFCAKHDNEIFSDIEKYPIQSNEQHAFLLSYRALCRELFAKEGAALLLQQMQALDSGLDPFRQVVFQGQLKSMRDNTITSHGELRENKNRYDGIFKSRDYSSMRYFVVWFDQPPDIMCSGGKCPDWDFSGNQIQDFSDHKTPLQMITLSLLTSQEQGCAYFSWLDCDDYSCIALMKSLAEMHRELIPHAIARFVLLCFENQFWRPDWWEGLGKSTQDSLINRFMAAMCTSHSDYLTDDGVRIVDWRITRIETNVYDLKRFTM